MNNKDIQVEVEKRYKQAKKKPTPDHICARIGRVIIQSGNAMMFADELKYSKADKAVVKKNLIDALTMTIVEAHRCLETL